MASSGDKGPLSRVRFEWLRRVEAEYQSAAIAQHFTLWLIQIGASPDLISDGLRITQDEVDHSHLSHQVYVAAGGNEPPNIDRSTLELRRHYPRLEDDVLRVGVRFFCLGETVAVPLFQHMRKTCTEPVARQALDRILVDEVRHRDFGWTLLGWLMELPIAEELRENLQRQLPSMIAELHEAYGDPTADHSLAEVRPTVDAASELSAVERAWGLASPPEYSSILARSIRRDYIPRFEKLGIDTSALAPT